MNFHIEDDAITVNFEGIEQFWAIKRRLVMPKARIARVFWQEELNIPRAELGWRVGGAAIPGSVFAGRFWGNQGKNFMYLAKTRGMFQDIQTAHVLTIELSDYPYRRLFFTVDDPTIADSIVTWWSSST